MPAIRPEICTKGWLLNRSQQLSLITPVIHEEVSHALQGINDIKAPDGMVLMLVFQESLASNRCRGNYYHSIFFLAPEFYISLLILPQ